MSHVADRLPSVFRQATEAEICATGTAPRPQIHFLRDDVYLGYLVCRFFYRGADAAKAIADLGRLPSVVQATRLFVLWEDYDLRVGLEIPESATTTALVIVDARLDGHTLHWNPLVAELGAKKPLRKPKIIVQWRTPARYENVELLAPVQALIHEWRKFREADLGETVHQLEAEGYEFYPAFPI